MEKSPASGSGRPYRRSVRNYLIDRAFQLKWTLSILILTACIFGTLGAYIVQHEAMASEALLSGLADMYGQDGAAIMADMLKTGDSSVLWVLMASGGALIFALAGMGIVLTHKVAGPVYALTRSIESVRRGNWRQVRGVRKGDEFQELSETWKGMVTALREKEAHELGQLESLKQRRDVTPEVRAILTRLMAEKRAYIE